MRRTLRGHHVAPVIAILLTIVALMVSSPVPAYAQSVTVVGDSDNIQRPVLPTALLSFDKADPGFRDDLQSAVEEYEAVYILGARPEDLFAWLPELDARATVPDAQGTAIVRLDGHLGLAAITSNRRMSATETVNALTALVDSGVRIARPMGGSLGGIELTALAQYYNYSLPPFGWGARMYNGSAWVGDVRQWHNCQCLMNDGDPATDYWVSDIIQQMDPGANLHGSYWRSDELRAKFLRNGYVNTIVSCLPNDIGSDNSPITFTIGWPPSVTISFDKLQTTIDNQSSPALGYARWVADWNPFSNQSGDFSQLNPAYSAQVSEGRAFSAYVYVTTLWNEVIGARITNYKTYNHSPYSFSRVKPAP